MAFLFVTPKFCISIVFSFFWEIKWPKEKLKTTLMQNLGCKQRALWYVMVFFWNGQSEFNHVVTFEGRSKPKYVLVEKLDIIVLPA